MCLQLRGAWRGASSTPELDAAHDRGGRYAACLCCTRATEFKRPRWRAAVAVNCIGAAAERWAVHCLPLRNDCNRETPGFWTRKGASLPPACLRRPGWKQPLGRGATSRHYPSGQCIHAMTAGAWNGICRPNQSSCITNEGVIHRSCTNTTSYPRQGNLPAHPSRLVRLPAKSQGMLSELAVARLGSSPSGELWIREPRLGNSTQARGSAGRKTRGWALSPLPAIVFAQCCLLVKKQDGLELGHICMRGLGNALKLIGCHTPPLRGLGKRFAVLVSVFCHGWVCARRQWMIYAEKSRCINRLPEGNVGVCSKTGSRLVYRAGSAAMVLGQLHWVEHEPMRETRRKRILFNMGIQNTLGH